MKLTCKNFRKHIDSILKSRSIQSRGKLLKDIVVNKLKFNLHIDGETINFKFLETKMIV